MPKEPQKLTDYSNILFGGTTVAGGTGTGIVLTVGQETVYGGLTPSVEARKQGFDRGANSIAWVLIRFMTVLVPVVFLASGLTKGDWLEAFFICTFCCSRNHTGAASDGGQRLSGKRQSFDGKETDNRKKYQCDAEFLEAWMSCVWIKQEH